MPNTRVLRLPLASLYLRIAHLRALRYCDTHLIDGLAAALAHVVRCAVRCSPLGPNLIPPLESFAIMAHQPLLNLSPTLPSFSGCPDDDVDTFLSRLACILAAYPDITAAQKIFYLENQTSHGAQELIQRTLQFLADHPDAPPVVRNNETIYAHLVTTLREAYSPNNDRQQFKDALQKRVKLESESINMYVQSVLSLCRRAGINDLASQLSNLHKGLPL